jgi:hypothetical protein
LEVPVFWLENTVSDRPENLKDLVVVIVGASSGFGRGAALKLGA